MAEARYAVVEESTGLMVTIVVMDTEQYTGPDMMEAGTIVVLIPDGTTTYTPGYYIAESESFLPLAYKR